MSTALERLKQPEDICLPLECPEAGGDTIFADTAQPYETLSRAFQTTLHGLGAEREIENGRTAIYPVIRTHPITEEEALFIRQICESHSTSVFTMD